VCYFGFESPQVLLLGEKLSTLAGVCIMNSRKVYISLTIVITLCVLTGCDSGDASVETALQLPDAAVLATAVAEADALFKQREDVSKLREAISTLANIRTGHKRVFEIEWRLAKYKYFLGKQTTDKKEATTIFTDGRDAGEAAAKLEASRPEGHFWYGANLGELARMDMLSGLKSIDAVRSSMNRVLEIDPAYQKASAYDGLAQVEMETRLTGGSAAKAAELLEKALTIERQNAYLNLHLANAYLMLKRESDARRQLESILQMTPDPEYVIEYRESLAEAKKLLASRFSS
jgi:tetratricopeptide (TPR) repeat protein